MSLNCLSKVILDSAFRVHSALGPGLFEHVYEVILAHELKNQHLEVARQVPIPIVYDGIEFEEEYRAKGMGLKIVGDAADSVLQVQAPSFAMDPIAWVLARGLTGFCFAGLFIVVESWLNSAATDETRGQILSVYAMTGLLSGIVGQLLLPATDTAGFKPFCIVAIIIALALVPIALTRAVAPTHEGGGARISLKGLYRQSPFGLVAASLCGVTASAFFTLGPIFVQRRGLDTGGIAAFMASGTLGGFLMAWPLGWLSDRLDRRLVIIGAAVTAAATLSIMMALVPDEATRWMLYLCAGVFGGTIIPTYSIVMAHVNDAVGEGEFVAASGGLLIMQGVGAVIGPLLAGFVMSTFEQGLGYTLIATQLLMAVFGVYRLTRKAAPPEMHKGIFVIEPSVPVGTALGSAHSSAPSRI